MTKATDVNIDQMNFHLNLVLPVVAAIIYVFGALFVKRSGDFWIGIWRTAFVANMALAAVFQAMLLAGGTIHWELLWQPAVEGALALLGQHFTFLALQRGDVSVAIPVMSLKIVLVAFFTTLLLTQAVSAQLWAAAVLSSLAILLLNRTGGAKLHNVGVTVVYAAMSATMFALCDVLIQKWVPAWGAGRFLPLMMVFLALFSLLFIPFFSAPLTCIPRAAWPPLLLGGALIGGQSLVITMVIVTYQDATSANILYSSNGLWSVIAVWAVGHWFASREQHLGAGVLRWRLIGAALMLVAISLVLVN